MAFGAREICEGADSVFRGAGRADGDGASAGLSVFQGIWGGAGYPQGTGRGKREFAPDSASLDC